MDDNIIEIKDLSKLISKYQNTIKLLDKIKVEISRTLSNPAIQDDLKDTMVKALTSGDSSS